MSGVEEILSSCSSPTLVKPVIRDPCLRNQHCKRPYHHPPQSNMNTIKHAKRFASNLGLLSPKPQTASLRDLYCQCSECQAILKWQMQMKSAIHPDLGFEESTMSCPGAWIDEENSNAISARDSVINQEQTSSNRATNGYQGVKGMRYLKQDRQNRIIVFPRRRVRFCFDHNECGYEADNERTGASVMYPAAACALL